MEQDSKAGAQEIIGKRRRKEPDLTNCLTGKTMQFSAMMGRAEGVNREYGISEAPKTAYSTESGRSRRGNDGRPRTSPAAIERN